MTKLSVAGQDAGASVPDRAGQASPEAAKASSPSGDHPSRKGRYEQDAIVLQDGHIDRITGPRCVVRMLEGQNYGLYLLASTDEVLPLGALVWRDEITRKARRRDSDGSPEGRDAQHLDGAAATARADEGGIAQPDPATLARSAGQ